MQNVRLVHRYRSDLAGGSAHSRSALRQCRMPTVQDRAARHVGRERKASVCTRACKPAQSMTVALRQLIEDMVSDLERNPLDTHAARLTEIAQVVPHTISALPSAEPLEKYNCVMHAPGLIGRMDQYPHPLLVAKTAFVSYLVDEALQPCEPGSGALVTWSAAGKLTHVGKLVSPDRAESKWGNGILCAHGLEETPFRYGDVSGFYCSIRPDVVLHHLERFVFGEPSA